MGNCVLHKGPQPNFMSKQKSWPNKSVTSVVSKDVADKEDLFRDLAIKSPISDRGDRCSNWVQASPKFVSRIPVLTSPNKSSHLSKSVLSIRTPKTRIPITQKLSVPVETTHNLEALHPEELECSRSQLNESGFVSDFSVTNSGYSQINMESKPEKVLHSLKATNKVDIKSEKPEDPLPMKMLSQSDETPNLVQIRPISCRQQTISDKIQPSHGPELQEPDSVNIVKRPQSLSCESEILITKFRNKRLSEVSMNPHSASPSAFYQDHNTVLQDVSQLKLMLHKLKRSLLQETHEVIIEDSLFRPDTPLCTDIKLLLREELEQKYEKLLARNIHLERLLQSREKVIAQMQTDKECSFEVYCRSPVESNPTEFFSPKNIKSINDIPPLQYQSAQRTQSRN